MRIDRISSLPDSLLCRILSFLPTTTSVATCVLSRRWRHLWEYLQVFNFDDSFFQPCESPERRFVDFVNKVLTLRRGDDIQKFSLSCSMFGICDEASMWVRAAIGPHLQEMNISMPIGDLCLPQSLFTCTALVSLTLVGGVEFYLLSSVHLPSLKKLELDIALMYSTSKLVSGCPVLETLQVRFELWCGISKLISPSLKSLTSDIPYFDSRLLIGLLRNCRMLRVLIINSWQGTPHQSHEPGCWTRPTIVPTCVMSHLQIFKFGGYHDFADERAFVIYILETGLVLKTMTIHCNTSLDLEEKHDILKGLSMISRGSNMCQLEFD